MELIISDDHAGLRNHPQSSISISPLSNDAFPYGTRRLEQGAKRHAQRDRPETMRRIYGQRDPRTSQSRGQKIIGRYRKRASILALG